jgi:hypothetical protein
MRHKGLLVCWNSAVVVVVSVDAIRLCMQGLVQEILIQTHVCVIFVFVDDIVYAK